MTVKTSLISCLFFWGLLLPSYLTSQTVITGKVMDKASGEFLAYATVHCSSASTVTNENGAFVLKPSAPVHWIAARYVGYKTDTLRIGEGTATVIILLESLPLSLNPVTVTAREDSRLYRSFIKALASVGHLPRKLAESRAFFRSFTIVDGVQPAEYFEAYYNMKCSGTEVRDAKLKAGRFLLPRQCSFLNMSSVTLPEMFKPFLNSNSSCFPVSPLSMTNWRQLRQYYTLAIVEKSLPERDTLVHYRFTARDTVDFFSGDLYYRSLSDRIEKIILKASGVKEIPFLSLADSVNHRISDLSYSVEMGFDTYQGSQVLNYLVMGFQFRITGKEGTRQISTSMKLLLYDYEKSFQLPVFRSITDKNDYLMITYFPYNADFFRRNAVIAENDAERRLRKVFDSIPCFDSRNKNDSFPFLPKRIEPWSENWMPEVRLAQTSPVRDAHHRLKHYKYEKVKPAWDSTFASTMLYLDYDCWPDTVLYTTNALIDYKYSYILRPDTLSTGYFRMYLDIARIAANRMLAEARRRFAGRCPTPQEMQALYDAFNTSYELDIYNLYSNSNSERKPKFFEPLKKIIRAGLEATRQ